MENEEKESPKKWYRFLWNPYLLVGVVFVIWMLFFDQNSYLMHKSLGEDLEELETDKAFYQEKIDKESTRLQEIESNPEEYEKMAREKFYMKRENEDIYVIEKKDSI